MSQTNVPHLSLCFHAFSFYLQYTLQLVLVAVITLAKKFPFTERNSSFDCWLVCLKGAPFFHALTSLKREQYQDFLSLVHRRGGLNKCVFLYV